MPCVWRNMRLAKQMRPRRSSTLKAESSAEGPARVSRTRACAWLSAALVLIAALRIVSNYTVLSHTIDEPIHLGAGMEWLDHGTITGDASHPPMPRALGALGPWLAGEHWHAV